MQRLLPITLLLCCTQWLLAQDAPLSNWRLLRLRVDTDQQVLDSLTVLPASLSVFDAQGVKVDTSKYSIADNFIFWDKTMVDSLDPQIVDLRFRVLPYALHGTTAKLDTSMINAKSEGGYITFDYDPFKDQRGLIDQKGIDYNGSFSRGLSVGNNQNLVFNSDFNLQLAGTLGDDVEVLAAITDQNIPLQPEGNTQQLREFDKIFIQLKKDSSTFTAGDYELASPNSYFMNYFKKLEGATLQNSKELGKGTLKTQVSGAISRGKFSRTVLQQLEGNQGPYKLFGSSGERFVIILAGTEKIFIDGELMKRGLEEDYTIDYNQAEVTFTSRRLITKDSRIIIEYEFADQKFLRWLYSVNTEYVTDKWRFHANLYSEQDAKNSGGVQELDSLDRTILSRVGDSLDLALGDGIDTIEEFSEFRVLYKLVDTLFFNGTGEVKEPILVYTTNPDSAKYEATFLEVGPGQGNYIRDDNVAANGRVFRWVAPDANGRPQGSFSPKRRLVAPNRRQLFTFGADYRISKTAMVQTEIALSGNDLNRFSEKDDGDNVGAAVYTRYRQAGYLGKKEKGWQLKTNLDYEFVDQKFRPLNPYRPSEFTRDWNLTTNMLGLVSGQTGTQGIERATENLGKIGFELSKTNNLIFGYQFSGFLRGDIYTGTKHTNRLRFEKAGFLIDGQASLLQTKAETGDSRFFRPKLDISKEFKKLGGIRLGVYGEREKNSRLLSNSDTLSQSSFYYDLYKVYLTTATDKKWNLGINYTQRYDFAPVDTEFKEATKANNYTILGSWQQSKSARLTWNLTYRELLITDPDLIDQDPQATFLGRTDYNIQAYKGAIRSTTTYELSSGQEPRIQITYLKVNPGEGTHIWLDSINNNDGLIQPNEMEISPFQDIADYIRVSTVTNEFIRTNNIQFNQSLRIDPRIIWYGKKDWRKALSKFSTQSTLLINRKTREGEDVSAWNPFQFNIDDEVLVSINSRIANTLFFNRANPNYDLQIGQFDLRNRTVLTTGYESRKNTEQFFRARWNVTQKISLQLNTSTGRRDNDSEFFDNRDYQIQTYTLEPQFTFLPSRSFRAIISYELQDSENILKQDGETAVQNKFNLEVTYNKSSSTSLRLNTSFVNVVYEGQRSTPIEFAMLEGLRNGRNYLWGLTLDRRLARFLQLNFSYEGRKTGESRVVHVGRATLRATF